MATNKRVTPGREGYKILFNENSAHGEEAVKETPVKDLKPSENAKVSVSPIKIGESGKAQLVRISKNAKNLAPISDELMLVDDGESNAAVIEKTLDVLIGEEEAAKEKAKLSVSEETKAFLEEARARRIRIEENLLVNVNRLGRTFRNLVPIADELMLVDEGDSKAMEEIVDKMMEFVLDDSNEIASQSELDDVLADAAEMLKGLFDENPDLEA